MGFIVYRTGPEEPVCVYCWTFRNRFVRVLFHRSRTPLFGCFVHLVPWGILIPPMFLETISFLIVIFLSVSPEAVSVKGCPLLLSFFTISVRVAPGLFL